ncbi:MAG: Hsp70 family protein [Pseudomonadota bacterium]
MAPACGIDFGTSNSAVGIPDGQEPRLVPLQDDAVSVPTALFFSFEDDSLCFGQEAMERFFAQESGRYLRAIKSLLGNKLFEESTLVKRRRVPFADILAAYLGFLREAAGRRLANPPDSVVMGRPTFFVDDDSAADKKAQAQLEDAARSAGFENIAFQFEPIAAALDYEQSVTAEQIALVADIGGGTSDFSLVRVSPERAQSSDRRDDILGVSGVHIGGTDFDKHLAIEGVMPALGYGSPLLRPGLKAPSWYFHDLATWHRIPFLYDPKLMTEVKGVVRDAREPEKIKRLLSILQQRRGHALLAAVEAAKIELSTADQATLEMRDCPDDLTLVISQDHLNRGAEAAGVARISADIGDLLRRTGVKADAVSAVFLTGGATKMPLVRQAIAAALPEAISERRMVSGDLFGSVAKGLALDAARRFGPTALARQGAGPVLSQTQGSLP